MHKLLIVASLVLLAPFSYSQARTRPNPKDCRVCKGKPSSMARLDVVSHGGFDFAKSTTSGVEEIFDDKLPIYWIEGEHIKLGFAAVTFKLVDVTAGGYDNESPANGALVKRPFARAHAYLERAEETYAVIQKLLRVKDKDFPELDEAGEPIASKKKNAKYMGQGPHLGQPGKFEILILPGPGERQLYLESPAGLQGAYYSNAHVRHSGALSIALDLQDGTMWDDGAVWGYMTHFITHIFVSGYKFDAYQIPIWIEVGLAHAVERDVNHVYNSFCGNPAVTGEGHALNDWTEKVKDHLRASEGPYMERLLDRASTNELSLEDHLMAWSMVRFLLDKHSKAFAGVIGDLHGITKGKRSIGVAQIRNAHRDAIAKNLKMTYAEFDKAWSRWARKQVTQR